jgi:RHS repeat-associated protein
LFTGRRVDILDNGSLTIQYNRNRYYDYYTGRWTTHDPLGYIDGMNLYEYVKSNALILTDPIGGCKCKKCCVCCCVEDLRIENIKRLSIPGLRWGHTFDATADLEFKEWNQKVSKSCGLEWREWTDVLTPNMRRRGVKKNTWTDMYRLYQNSRMFAPLRDPALIPKCPEKKSVTIFDRPSLAIHPPDRTVSRTLKFHIIVKSTPGCPCKFKQKSVKARQVLTLKKGRPGRGDFFLGGT